MSEKSKKQKVSKTKKVKEMLFERHDVDVQNLTGITAGSNIKAMPEPFTGTVTLYLEKKYSNKAIVRDEKTDVSTLEGARNLRLIVIGKEKMSMNYTGDVFFSYKGKHGKKSKMRLTKEGITAKQLAKYSK